MLEAKHIEYFAVHVQMLDLLIRLNASATDFLSDDVSQDSLLPFPWQQIAWLCR